MKSLLINWVYYRPVGHVIEALRLASDVARANHDLRISLLLNADSPAELAECVDSVERVYSVGVGKPIPRELPREWDYILIDPRASAPSGWTELDRFHETFRSSVRGRFLDLEDPANMLPRKIEPLRLVLPERLRQLAAEQLAGDRSPRISVLPGSGTHVRSPSFRFWTAFFDVLFERHPRAEVILLGKLKGRRGARTKGVTHHDIEMLCARYPSIRDAFDVPLLEQLAFAEQCRLHISPHSGMSFAVQAVGVPWLAISGQEWHEYLLNGVPFISIFPDCPLYPCYREMYPECRTRMRRGVITPCLSDDALLVKLPLIVDAMEALLAGNVSYPEAARRHERALRERGVPNGWSITDWPAVVADDYVY